MMVAMWIVIMIQFSVIVWLVYDKLKKKNPTVGSRRSSVED